MSTPTAEVIEVGAFSFEPSTGTITGPAAYMQSESYRNVIDAIMSGRSTTFNYATQHGGSPTPEIGLLVTIQTDYAAWKGLQMFNASRGIPPCTQGG